MTPPDPPTAPFRLVAVRRWSVLVTAVTVVLSTPSPGGGVERPVMGRPLIEVLGELRDEGLDLVFSTAVVDEDLRVVTEPSAAEPRAILEEILPSLGLRVREGPGGTLLVVPSEPERATLRGRVVTGLSEMPVRGARIHLEGAESPVTTDGDGRYEIRDIAPGTHDVVIEATGFRAVTYEDVPLLPGQVVDLQTQLEPLPRPVTEVLVNPARHTLVQQEPAPETVVSREEAALAPTSGGDIARVVELLPGVAAPDNSAAFNVRGSLARDASVVLDGFEIYDPYHLQSFQSPFSMVDSSIVDRLDFFGGGFTADRGDRHGAFVDITTIRAGRQARGELALGTVNSRLTWWAPIERGEGSWLVSTRAWYPEAVIDTTELGGHEDLDPRFADLYAKGAFQIAPRHRLSAHGLLSYDRLRFVEVEDGVLQRAAATTSNAYAWLRLLSGWTDAWSSETILSGGHIDRRRDGISAEEETLVVEDDRRVEFFGLEHDSIWHLTEGQALKAGFGIRRLLAAYRYSLDVPADPGASSALRLDPDGTSLALYLAHRARITPELVAELGLRWDRQSHTDDNQLSPRLNAVWRPGESWEARLSLGRFQQSQRIHELHVEDGEDEFHIAEASEQAEVSIQKTFASGVRLRLNAYYRELSDLRPRYENLFEPIDLFPEVTEDRVRIAPEAARLQGIELLARGALEKPLFWWVSYSLSSAEDLLDGRYVPRSWDQTHAAKFLIGWRQEGRWSISLSGSVHTGWPTTPISGDVETLPNGDEEFTLVPGERNSERFPTYARFDLKGRRSFEVARGRVWLDLEILNVTDRENPCCLDDVFFSETPGGEVRADRQFGHWLGTSASFSVLWEF